MFNYLYRSVLLFCFALLSLINRAEAEQSVTYGSTILLLNTETNAHLYSGKITWSNGNQVATCSKDADTDNYFYIREEGVGGDNYKGAGHPVMCGETIRLLHSNTEKYLSVDASSKSMVSRQAEAYCGSEGGKTSLFYIECEKEGSSTELKIGDRFKLLNVETKNYLVSSKRSIFDSRNCPRCPIIGQYEVSFTKKCKGDGLWTFKGVLLLHSDNAGASSGSSKPKDEL